MNTFIGDFVMEARISDLRRRMKDVKSAISRCEHVVLTYRGRKFAIMIPFEEEKKKFKAQNHPAFGMWADREDMADPVAYVAKIRQPRVF